MLVNVYECMIVPQRWIENIGIAPNFTWKDGLTFKPTDLSKYICIDVFMDENDILI